MNLLPVVILAGGFGTRLRPYTETLPKSLILVAGRPFIDYQLRLLKSCHIDKVCLLTGYHGESIQQYVGDGTRYGLDISYHNDGDYQKGTAGCIESAWQQLPSVFFVLYGDSYLPIDFSNVQERFFSLGKPALITICINNSPEHANNIDFDGSHIISYDKINNKGFGYIDYGLSVFNKSVFTNNDGKQRDLGDYFQQLIADNALGYQVVEQPFYEVGSMKGINHFREYLHA